jgi:hypothetical protein
MCLTTKTFVSSVSEKEIKCYKVLLWDDGEYMTPYQKAFVPKFVREGNVPFFADGEKNIGMDYCEETLSDSYVIGRGFVHTCKNLASAYMFTKHLEVIYPHCICAIFECEIPIGTKYYEGKDDLFMESFASEKIIFKHQIL